MIGRASVALCMVVRDDVEVLARVLPLLPPVVDTWVVVDLGSRDATARTVRRHLTDRPGTLHHRPRRDLSSNRTELLQLADGAADFLLLLEADEAMFGELPAALDADAYEIPCEGDPTSWELRLLRSGLGWRCHPLQPGRLMSDAAPSIERTSGLVVRRDRDAPLRKRRLKREERRLAAALLADPTDPDVTFRLAEVHRERERFGAAVDLFQRRAAMAGDDEDAFHAAYQAGALTAREEPEAGIGLLLEAWARRPGRVEPLYEAAVAARLQEQHERALALAEQGASIQAPAADRLVHQWMVDWGIPIERAVALGHLGRLDEAAEIVDDLLERDGFPPWLDVDLLLTRQWLDDERVLATGAAPWTPPLTTKVPEPASGFEPVPRPRRLEELIGPVPTSYLGGELEHPWTMLNPSIANGEEGFGILMRIVNWRYLESTPEAIAEGRYVIQGRDRFNRNRTLLQLHDAAGDIVSTTELFEPLHRPRLPLLIRGFEDCRLFWWRDSWHAVVCVSDISPYDQYQMAMVRIDGDHFEDFVPLLGPTRHPQPEKNWMPFVVGDRLLFVYGPHPFVVLEWDPERLHITEVQRVATPPSMAGLRGGSQGVRVDDGWVFLVHERRVSTSRHLYVHQLLKIDDSFTPVGLSPPFVLQRYGIEFVAGMAEWGTDLLLSFGVQDRTAWLAAVPRDRFLELLEPIILPVPTAEAL
jgi:tetratricopeptide (TPR) repeat protein